MNIAILGLDVNRSTGAYRAERLEAGEEALELPEHFAMGAPRTEDGLPQVTGWGIRLSLADVKGISEDEIARIVAGAPFVSLSDFWARARASEPVVERLILAGAFDRIYDIGRSAAVARHGRVTRRDLLLALADLHRSRRADERTAARSKGRRRQALTDDPAELARLQRVQSDRAGQAVQGPSTSARAAMTPPATSSPPGCPRWTTRNDSRPNSRSSGWTPAGTSWGATCRCCGRSGRPVRAFCLGTATATRCWWPG
nr:hypothetical protein [Tessaracoccus coleopterorum]